MHSAVQRYVVVCVYIINLKVGFSIIYFCSHKSKAVVCCRPPCGIILGRSENIKG